MHEFSPFNDETQLTDKAGSTFALVLKGCWMTRCYNGASCCFEQGGETLPRPTKLPINGEN
ncbi:hypothetical protein ABFA07_020634 [Porites harrisoni]